MEFRETTRRILSLISEKDNNILLVLPDSICEAEEILQKFKNTTITVFCPQSSEIANLEKRYPGRLKIADGAQFFEDFSPREKYQAIIMPDDAVSLLVSQAWSSGESKHHKNSVSGIMSHAASLASPKGRIIVSNTVASTFSPKVMIQYETEAQRKDAQEFLDTYKGPYLEVTHTALGDIVPYNVAIEIIHALLDGTTKSTRNRTLWRTFYSVDDWKLLEARLFMGYGFAVEKIEKYLPESAAAALPKICQLRSVPKFLWDGGVKTRRLNYPAMKVFVSYKKG